MGKVYVKKIDSAHIVAAFRLVNAYHAGNLPAAKSYLKQGADIYNAFEIISEMLPINGEEKQKEKESIISLLISYMNASDIVASSKTVAVIKKLIINGVNPDTLYIGGCSILSVATQNCDTELVNTLFNHNANPNITNKDGTTAISWAIVTGCTGIMKCLLNKGADLNIRDSYGNTSLTYASEKGSIEIFKILVQYNADLNFKDKNGSSLLHIAFWNMHQDTLIKELSGTKKGCSILNLVKSSLNESTQLEAELIVYLLCRNGVNFNAEDSFGSTVFDYAYCIKDIHFMKMFEPTQMLTLEKIYCEEYSCSTTEEIGSDLSGEVEHDPLNIDI